LSIALNGNQSHSYGASPVTWHNAVLLLYIWRYLAPDTGERCAP